MRADEIKHALSRQYRADHWIFLTEVKTGPTHSASEGELKKIDAVAIKKSWTQPCINAFEVKVSRGDFMNDTKWPGYLPYCHRFYWACPSGLIKPSEVSTEAGLVWIADNGSYHTKKKALFRHIEIPHAMFYHLIISHTKNGRHPFFSDAREYAQAYCQDRAARQGIGANFKSALIKERDELRGQVSDLQSEIKSFEWERKSIEEIRAILAEHNISTWQLAKRLKEKLGNAMPTDLRRHLLTLKDTLNRINLESE